MKRILMFVFICLFSISVAASSLFSVVSVIVLLIGKYDDVYVMGLFLIPLLVYTWVAWLSKESTKRIKGILYGDSDKNRG